MEFKNSPNIWTTTDKLLSSLKARQKRQFDGSIYMFVCLFFAYCNLFFMCSVPPDSTVYVSTALAYFCCCPETKSQKTQTVFKGNEGRRCFTPVHSKSSGTWKNRRLLLKGTYPGLTGTITGSPSLLRLLSIPLRRSCWTRKLFKKGILASAQLNIEIDV